MKALWFRISARRALDKGESGWTSVDTRSVDIGTGIAWMLDQLPEGSVTMDYNAETRMSTVIIDWAQVPAAIERPVIPANRR